MTAHELAKVLLDGPDIPVVSRDHSAYNSFDEVNPPFETKTFDRRVFRGEVYYNPYSGRETDTVECLVLP
jgi:hypothetical protein